ncbi:hypothetical protein [uncultured Slackia sp.]|uniref:hypothetical protein n=1 Tax=uncultured Slackia sp. TaxID=665903 RepID=UPI0026DC8371|nr:hypothetical protein [uncultured Slackia sp.]
MAFVQGHNPMGNGPSAAFQVELAHGIGYGRQLACFDGEVFLDFDLRIKGMLRWKEFQAAEFGRCRCELPVYSVPDGRFDNALLGKRIRVEYILRQKQARIGEWDGETAVFAWNGSFDAFVFVRKPQWRPIERRRLANQHGFGFGKRRFQRADALLKKAFQQFFSLDFIA